MICIRYCVVEKKWTACIVATTHIMVAMVFFMATSLTPLITPAIVDAGLAEAGGNYTLFNTGEHIGYILLQILKLFFP